MLLLFALACSLAAVADGRFSTGRRGSAPAGDGGLWRARQEYEYLLDGRCLAHLPSLNKQVAGFQYRGRLLLQAPRENMLLLKMENVTYAKSHTQVLGSWWDRLPDVADDDAYRELPLSKHATLLKLDSGLIHSVVVSDELEDWEVNFVQGVAGALQADLSGAHAEQPADQPPSNDIHGRGGYRDAPVYSVFEDSVSGRCEVTYEVGELSKMAVLANPSWVRRPDLCSGDGGLLEVVKTRNHSNCHHVAESHFGLRPALRCTPADANCGDFWTRSSMTRLVGCGSRRDLLLLSASSSSQVVVNLHLHNGTEAAASCFLRLNLADLRPLNQSLPLPHKEYSRKIVGLSYLFRGKKLETEPIDWIKPTEKVPSEDVAEAAVPEIEIDAEEPDEPESTTAEGEGTTESQFFLPTRAHAFKPYWGVHETEAETEAEAEPTEEYNLDNNVASLEFPEGLSDDLEVTTSTPEPTEAVEVTTRRSRHKSRSRHRSRNRLSDNDNQEAENQQEENQQEDQTQQEGNGLRWSRKNHQRRTRAAPVRHGLYSPLPRPLSPYYVSHRAGDAHACMVQQLKELVTDIAADLEEAARLAHRRTLEKLAVAVEMCRALSLPDLQRAVAGVMDARRTDTSLVLTERKVYRDVVKLCGTSPAFQLARSLLETRKLTGEEAAQFVSALPAALIAPDAALLHSFYEMVRSKAVQEDAALKASAVLAFSQLVRVACVDEAERRARFPPEAMRDACSRAQAGRFIAWLERQLGREPALRTLYFAALGNTGSFSAVKTLKAAALNGSLTAQERAAALLSLRQVALRRPEAVSQLLLVTFRDYAQPLPVRLAAGALLLFTRPGPALWHRIATATWFEPSPAVVAFVWTTLNSLATSEDPVTRDMSEWARGVLKLAKPAAVGPQLPYSSVWASTAAGMRQLLLHQVSYSPAVDGASLYFRRLTRLGGFSNNEIQADLWASDPARLLELALQHAFPAASRPPAAQGPHSLDAIRQKLRIAGRKLPRLQGSLRLNFGGLRDRLFLFDKHLVDDIDKAVQTLVSELPAGKEAHYQSVSQDELVMATVTELGFPVSFQLKSLLLGRAAAKARLNLQDKQLSVEGSALVTAQLLSELGVYTGWDDVLYLAASHATSLVRLPKTRLRASVKEQTLQLSLEPQAAAGEPQLVLHHSSTPFTAQHDILSLAPASLSKNAKPDLTAPEHYSLKAGDLHVEYESRQRPASLSDWLFNSAPVFGFPLLWDTLDHAKVQATLARWHHVTLDIAVDHAQVADGVYSIQRVALEGAQTTAAPATSESTAATEPLSSLTTMSPTSGGTESTSASTTQVSPTTESTTTTQSTTSTESTTTTESTTSTQSTTTAQSTPITVSAATTESTTTAQSTTTTQSTTTVQMTPNLTTLLTGLTATPENVTLLLSTTLAPTEAPKVVANLTVTNRQAASWPTPFNATDLDPFSETINGSSILYLLDKVFNGTDYGRAVAVTVNASVLVQGEPAASGYQGVATVARALDARLIRAGVFLNSEEDSWQIAATGSWEVDPLPFLDVDSLLRSNLASNISADFVYQANETRYIVLVKGSASRGEQRRQQLLATLEGACPPPTAASADARAACVRVAHAAALANKYDLSFNFNEPVMEFLETPADQRTARVVLEVDEQRDLLEAWVRAPPRREPDYRTYPLGPLLPQLLLLNPATGFDQGFYTSAYCGVSGQLFHTFDGVAFEYTLGSEWHLLTKDCSGRTGVAVLVRQPTAATLEVEVNAEDYRVARLGPGGEASVSGQPLRLEAGGAADVRDTAGGLLMRLSQGRDAATSLLLPQHGLHLRFRNATLLISASMSTRGRLCGICGNNDGEYVGDLTNPRGNQEKTRDNFAASYKL